MMHQHLYGYFCLPSVFCKLLRRAKASRFARRRTSPLAPMCLSLGDVKTELRINAFCGAVHIPCSAVRRNKKMRPTTWVRIFLLWRRRRDSNPCGLAPKRFSRPPRYDHFDTPPYAAIIVECSCIVNGRKGILPAYMFGLNVRIQQYHLVAFDGRSAISAIIIELVEYAETVLLIKIDRRGI